MSNLLNYKKINFILFASSTYYFFLFNNLYYLSTNSPDFDKYINYYYFYSDLTVQNSSNVQGGLYFWLVSVYFTFKSKLVNNDNYEILFSTSIQFVNLILFLLGMYGIFLLLKLYKVSSEKIFMIFTFTNFFPVTNTLKLTFKNEILVFAILPFAFYFLEKFERNKDILNLIYTMPFLLIILTTKASAIGMIIAYLIFRFKDLIKEIYFKHKKIILIFIIFLTPVILENQILNDKNLLQESHPERYDNVIKFENLFSNPLNENISVTKVIFSDVFGDFYDLYWDYDSSFYNKNRKNIFLYGESFGINFTERNIEFNLTFLKNTEFLDKFREMLSLFLFLNLLLYVLFKRKQIRKYKYIISPIVGYLILLLNSLGFPTKNFDPFTMDTFKSYYLSFFWVISFVFLLVIFLKENKKSYVYLFIFSFCILFIYGIPKKNDTFFNEMLLFRAQNIEFCELNLNILTLEEQSKYNYSCLSSEELFCLSDSYYLKDDLNNYYFSKVELSKDSIFKVANSYEECLKLTNEGYDNKIEKIFVSRTPFISLSYLILCIGILVKNYPIKNDI